MKEAQFSYEFFPPGNALGERRFWRSLGHFEMMDPGFFSITYGAMGSGQQRSITTIENVIAESDVPIAAHLTFEGSTRQEIDDVARHLASIGIERIVALRGDDRENAASALQRGPCYRDVAEFIAGLLEIYPFDISVACYPEVHPKAECEQSDLQALKAKFDAGANRAISQFFFDADMFERFRDRAVAAGIDQPLVAGVLPIRDFGKVTSIAAQCGATIPQRLIDLFAKANGDTLQEEQIARQEVERFIDELIVRGCSRFHIYTLNKTIDLRQLTGRSQIASAQTAAIA